MVAGDGLNRARKIKIYLFTATGSTIVSSRMLCDSRYLVEPVDIRFSTLKRPIPQSSESKEPAV